ARHEDRSDAFLDLGPIVAEIKRLRLLRLGRNQDELTPGRFEEASSESAHGVPSAEFPSPLAGEGGAHRASDGRVRGLFPSAWCNGDSPLTPALSRKGRGGSMTARLIPGSSTMAASSASGR